MMRLGSRYLLAAIGASVFAGSLLGACAHSTTGDESSGVGGSPSGAGGNLGAGGSQPGLGGANTSIAIPVQDAQDAGTPDATPATATGDANCGSTTSEVTKKPADLLLVLDRSSSMTRAMDSSDSCAAGSTTCSQRWETMLSSLETVLSNSPPDVYWGLKFFTSPATTTTTGGRPPTTSACYVAPGVEVPVKSDNASAIQDRIIQAGTASSTPTRTAIETAVTYLDSVADGNPKYILLATDGEPNCTPGSTSTSTSDLAGTIEAVGRAAAAGYKVFVIGVGPEAANLTEIAQAGQTEHFYSASTPEELSSALGTIVGTVAAGCNYQFDTPTANPNAIGVYIDKSLVPQSSTDGWTYDASTTTIQINGSYCTDLTSGAKKRVEIYLPCKPDEPLPPVIL
jgi:hypothetical protein